MQKRKRRVVANPKKPPQIESILKRNKEKLLVFLKEFHNDKDGVSRHGVTRRYNHTTDRRYRRAVHGRETVPHRSDTKPVICSTFRSHPHPHARLFHPPGPPLGELYLPIIARSRLSTMDIFLCRHVLLCVYHHLLIPSPSPATLM